MMRQNELHFLRAQGAEGVGKAHPRVELRVPRQAFFSARHANENQAEVAPIIGISHLLHTLHL
jgi:hypothetical protein